MAIGSFNGQQRTRLTQLTTLQHLRYQVKYLACCAGIGQCTAVANITADAAVERIILVAALQGVVTGFAQYGIQTIGAL